MFVPSRAPPLDVSLGAFQNEVEHLCKHGLISEALQAARLWHREGLHVSTCVLHCILNGCIRKQNLALGREAHCLVVRTGFHSSLFLGGALIRMFALCGALSNANHVFSQLEEPDVYVWMVIISANAKVGQDEKALKLYRQMQEASVAPDGHVAVTVLKSCIAAKEITTGKLVHFQIIENRLEVDAFVGNILVDFYAKLGGFDDARGVFDRAARRDLVTWSAMIGGHVEHSQPLQAIQLFCQMQDEGIEPDRVILLSILRACSSAAALFEGRLLHIHILRKNVESEASVLNTIIDMYAKCGQIEDAKTVFSTLQERDLVAWNVMISGCVHAGQEESAFCLYCEVLQGGWLPGHVTFVSILKACSCGGALLEGMLVHCNVVERGLQAHVLVGNSLVDMYSKCNRLQDAECVFSKLPMHTVVTWNAMIAGHAHHGYAHKAVEHFQHMLLLGLEPNCITFVSILQAFSSPDCLYQGTVIHCYLKESFEVCDVLVLNALIDMYVNSGSFELALLVFNQMSKRDIVTWNTMIEGCAKFNCNEKAGELFQQMQKEGLEPDEITCNCMLKINPSVGRSIHDSIVARGFNSNIFIGNSLINMYCKCGSLHEAFNVFSRLPMEDIVTFNVMIEGYTSHGFREKACQLFKHMQQSGFLPDRGTFISAVCNTASLQQGKCLHVQMIESPYALDMLIGNSLVNMYARCGGFEDACGVFDRMSKRDATLWCSMIALCATHRNHKLALHYFKAMQQEGFKPTDSASVNLLSWLGQAGEGGEGLSNDGK